MPILPANDGGKYLFLEICCALIVLVSGFIIIRMFVVTNFIEATDQTVDGQFHIRKVGLTRGGYVAIRGFRADVEYTIPQYMAPGVYTDIYIPKASSESHDLRSGDFVIIQLFEDTGGKINFNGSPTFMKTTIRPIYDMFGSKVQRTVRVL